MAERSIHGQTQQDVFGVHDWNHYPSPAEVAASDIKGSQRKEAPCPTNRTITPGTRRSNAFHSRPRGCSSAPNFGKVTSCFRPHRCKSLIGPFGQLFVIVTPADHMSKLGEVPGSFTNASWLNDIQLAARYGIDGFVINFSQGYPGPYNLTVTQLVYIIVVSNDMNSSNKLTLG